MRPIDPGKHVRPETVDPGPAPILQWLKVAQLVIDDTYQRELAFKNWKAIATIAAQFRWSRFSPVFVSPIEGGRYAVIDGQHRCHAAALCGFSEVPCQIVPMTLEEQAESFAAVNGLVTKVTVPQLFKAALAAGDKKAVRMDAIARRGGCQLMTFNATQAAKIPGQIFALKTFGKLVDQFEAERIVQALRVMLAAEGYRDTPEIWAGPVLFPILRALARTDHGLGDGDLTRFLEDFDIWTVIDDIDYEVKRRIRLALPRTSRKNALEAKIAHALKPTTKEVAA